MMLMPLLMSDLTKAHNDRLHHLESCRGYIENLQVIMQHTNATFVKIGNLSSGGFEIVLQLPKEWFYQYEALQMLLRNHGYDKLVRLPDASLLCEHKNGNLLTLLRNPDLMTHTHWQASRRTH